ncbi:MULTISPECIES: hypothetical protein [Paenibacillus]|uniref:Serine protease n=1 Tax=Paenibacillus violae TaxID=3077234 RepID=A0ABU3RBM0_9BACL|nr:MULTISPECIES: hypothetical protein [Paenibacillus]MDU0201688.1 hypothetical protein [Paenibacillus sp. PFR10]MEC0265695.1 hypothetical protein [Paenibacillus anseongense]
MATFHEALKHKNRISPVLLKRAEVVAVGVGYMDPSKPALGSGVIVYTQKKIVPSSMNSLKGTLAKAGSSVPIRFVSAGEFKRHVAAPKPKAAKIGGYQGKHRPVPGGVSLGKVDPDSTGTGGLIVTKNNQLYILSNNHVLVKNNTSASVTTVQPGPADGGQAPADTLGRLFEFTKLIPNGVNFQDSALAKPTSNSLLNPRYLIRASGRLITVPGHVNTYPVGLQLMKSGRTSGFVRGTIEANHADVRVTYGGTLGVLTFRNQLVIRGTRGPVSLPGDSGSVWLRSSDNFAAGLNFAGSDNGMLSISNPIDVVMSRYGVRTAVPAAKGTFKAGVIRGHAARGSRTLVKPLSVGQRKRIRAVRAISK